MNQELLIKQIVEEVLKTINSENLKEESKCNNKEEKLIEKITKESYPLGEKIPEKIKSQSGVNLTDITLDKVISGELNFEDLRVSPETLEMQAQVAESVGREAFASNLRRAAELISVPDERILDIYNSLRPYRSTKKELMDIADELENKYSCKVNAEYVREAADVYEIRGRLKSN